MNKTRIYADHSATTRLCDAAWAAMTPFLRDEFGNPSSLHSFSKTPRKAIVAARAMIAGCIGADPEEIYFTSGGTESDNWVIKGSNGGVMASAYEHHAILNAAASEANRGRPVCYCKPKKNGIVDISKISQAWQDGVKVVSVMAANNEIGTCNDILPLAKYVHGMGSAFHTDAVQAVGHIPIDVKQWDCDFLSASAHKFNGPRGIGFLYMRKGCSLAPLMNGGQQELGLRAGTENVAAIVGMATALRENCNRMEESTRRLDALSKMLKDGIAKFANDACFPGSDSGVQLPGFVSVAFPGRSAEGIVHILDLKGIAVSAGAACDSKNTQISHVLRAINLPRKYAEGTVRISLGSENSESDVAAILSALEVAVKRHAR